MATAFNSVQHAQTLTTPHTQLDAVEIGGYVKVLYATIETTTDFDATDVITWFTAPANCRIVGGWLAYDDEAAATTLTVGDSDDPDGWLQATLINDGPSVTLLPSDKAVAVVGAYWVTDKVYATATNITSTIAVDVTGTGTVSLCLFYVSAA